MSNCWRTGRILSPRARREPLQVELIANSNALLLGDLQDLICSIAGGARGQTWQSRLGFVGPASLTGFLGKSLRLRPHFSRVWQPGEVNDRMFGERRRVRAPRKPYFRDFALCNRNRADCRELEYGCVVIEAALGCDLLSVVNRQQASVFRRGAKRLACDATLLHP